MSQLLVADIMTREPVTILPNTNLLECARKMVRKRVGSLILIQDKKPVGIISEKDILWALIKKSKKDLNQIKAIDISPRKIATIKPNMEIKKAFEKMRNLKFRRLPVISGNELVGLLTQRDILNFHPELYPEFKEFAEICEEAKKLQRIEKAKSRIEGVCEECGNMDILFRINGQLLCENCRDAI